MAIIVCSWDSKEVNMSPAVHFRGTYESVEEFSIWKYVNAIEPAMPALLARSKDKGYYVHLKYDTHLVVVSLVIVSND